MSPRISALLAGSAWALCAAFVLLSVPLYWSTSTSVVLLGVPQIVAVLALAALVLAFSSVGALIVARRPGNGVGWILCAAGLTIGATTLASGYAVFSLTGPSGLPATEWAAWFAYWIWVPGVGPAMTFGLLMFPDGRLPSRRWRVVGWLSTARPRLAVAASRYDLERRAARLAAALCRGAGSRRRLVLRRGGLGTLLEGAVHLLKPPLRVGLEAPGEKRYEQTLERFSLDETNTVLF
jgi:hypothetical protein